MKLEEKLTSMPVNQWKVDRIYAFDWYDGPREGVCSLTVPSCEFYFELLDERYNPDGLDDRLFRLSELPTGSVRDVVAAVPDLASPSESVRQKADERIDAATARKRPTALVIHSQDLENFLGCWQVDLTEAKTADWFAVLGIPQEPSIAED